MQFYEAHQNLPDFSTGPFQWPEPFFNFTPPTNCDKMPAPAIDQVTGERHNAPKLNVHDLPILSGKVADESCANGFGV